MVYAEEIEGAVLGACLLERSAQALVLKSLRAEMFYLTAHRVVFEAINALYARGAAVDMLTVTEELRAQGRLDDAGGPFAVAKLAAMAGVPVVFFTLEMTASELGERMVLAESSADPLRIRQGRLSPEEVEDVHRTAERMSALPVHVDDTPYINVDQLCVIAKSLRAKGLLGLLIVDYLQLLATVNPGRTREQEVAECSRKLKGLARSLGCPVIVSSQLNRQAEDRAGSPELRHLRESGAIEQDADLVILLHRPERYHIRVDPDTGWSTRGMGIATVAKHRNGATGKVYYGYNPSMTKIGEFAGTPVTAPANNLKRKNDEGKSSDLFGGSAG